MLAIRNLHTPDLKGFVDTIIGLLNELPEIDDLDDKLNKLIGYRGGFLGGIQRVSINTPGNISTTELEFFKSIKIQKVILGIGFGTEEHLIKNAL